jgi:O-antigen ligase
VNFLETLHLVCSYYVLYILPLVLLTRSKALRITAVFLVTIILFSSLKRTGILSLALGIMVFIFVGQYVENRFKVKSFAISLILLLSLGGIFLYLDTQGDESVLERFETIDQDHGSFRLEVWEHTSAMISNQDLGSLLIGNGYNTVERDSRLNKSAHNDFLEVTYDYGLVGAILYLAAIVSLFFCIVRMILDKSRYAPSLAMLFVIYMVSSMISHIIIYYWGNLFMLTIGFIIGNNRKDAAD